MRLCRQPSLHRQSSRPVLAPSHCAPVPKRQERGAQVHRLRVPASCQPQPAQRRAVSHKHGANGRQSRARTAAIFALQWARTTRTWPTPLRTATTGAQSVQPARHRAPQALGHAPYSASSEPPTRAATAWETRRRRVRAAQSVCVAAPQREAYSTALTSGRGHLNPWLDTCSACRSVGSSARLASAALHGGRQTGGCGVRCRGARTLDGVHRRVAQQHEPCQAGQARHQHGHGCAQEGRPRSAGQAGSLARGCSSQRPVRRSRQAPLRNKTCEGCD